MPRPAASLERIVRDDAEDDRHDARDQRGDRGYLIWLQEVPIGVGVVLTADDDRVEHHDAGHREEGDKTAADLAAQRRPRSLILKNLLRAPVPDPAGVGAPSADESATAESYPEPMAVAPRLPESTEIPELPEKLRARGP